MPDHLAVIRHTFASAVTAAAPRVKAFIGCFLALDGG
jgi:hypothetical protein